MKELFPDYATFARYCVELANLLGRVPTIDEVCGFYIGRTT